jgi:hypothetical protein
MLIGELATLSFFPDMYPVLLVGLSTEGRSGMGCGDPGCGVYGYIMAEFR